MSLLEYENQMFLDAFHEDGLLVAARGLGLERVFCSFLKVYSDPGNLVLVLNTNTHEETYFLERLEESATKPMPKVITTEYSIKEREAVYLEGGVLFVTSRILVVDMLTDRLPIHLVSGILIYNAHKIMESCQEAFILRLYRQKNKKGFVKAFSSHPQAFTAGFCHVERVMKSLFVRKLFLWPRFQASVVSYLDNHKIDVVELQLQMTPAMVACQTALLDLIDACIKELKRRNPTLDTCEVTVESALGRELEQVIRLHLQPVWHQLGPNTRQLIADIKTLSTLLQFLTQYDCVNFYNLVNSLRTSEKTFGNNSGWLFMDAADALFVHAKERIYSAITTKKGQQAKDPPKLKVALEECPKWAALKDVLEEIEGYLKEDGEESGKELTVKFSSSVLVAAADDKTCSQLKEYLCVGGQTLLQRLFNKTQNKDAQRVEEKYASNIKDKGRGKASKDPHILTLTQMVDTGSDSTEVTQPRDQSATSKSTSSSASYELLTSPVTVLHPLFGTSDPFSLVRTLEELQPKFVVLYDAHMMFVRQLEVYKASHPGRPLRVYFLMYSGSTEEQRYLTSLRREKEAFEYLIREKATMVIPEERDGRMDDDPELTRGVSAANATVNTRKGGQHEKNENVTQKVIVDMREFRSELPSLIHRRGIEIEPVTLEVGDYILTPDICVERKSVSDLIGSLNNGRLYNQCVSMCRYYERPVLLIEFDPNKSFALQGKYTISSEMNSSDTSSRLALLTLHFPRLRILWCQSPYATAELFHNLKMGREQPDAAKAMAISEDVEAELAVGKYNHDPQAILLKMPGVSTKNVHLLMNHVSNIEALARLSEQDLVDLLQSAPHAHQLYSFLHSAAPSSGPAPQTGRNKPYSRSLTNKGTRPSRYKATSKTK